MLHVNVSHLELTSEVLVCGSLSALPQCDESEAPEVGWAGGQQGHWEDGEREKEEREVEAREKGER